MRDGWQVFKLRSCCGDNLDRNGGLFIWLVCALENAWSRRCHERECEQGIGCNDGDALAKQKLGARKLIGAPGIATSKETTNLGGCPALSAAHLGAFGPNVEASGIKENRRWHLLHASTQLSLVSVFFCPRRTATKEPNDSSYRAQIRKEVELCEAVWARHPCSPCAFSAGLTFFLTSFWRRKKNVCFY